MSYELKIKAKSLAVEAQIIRAEEIKLKKNAKYHAERQHTEATAKLRTARRKLYEHRIWDVRREARATHIARAYLKGLSYRQVENKGMADASIQSRVVKLVQKYGRLPKDLDTQELLKAWFAS